MNDWKKGLTESLFESWDISCEACFYPFMTAGKNNCSIWDEEENENTWIFCLTHTFACLPVPLLMNCNCFYMYKKRVSVMKKYGIEEDEFQTVCASVRCQTCSLAQMLNEIKHHNKEDKLFNGMFQMFMKTHEKYFNKLKGQ